MKTTIDYKQIGTRIKKKRNELHLTQEKLANELNMTSFYLSKIENGKATATLETLAHIAHYLGIDLSYLIAGASTLEKKHYIDELNEICAKANKKELELIIKLARAVLED